MNLFNSKSKLDQDKQVREILTYFLSECPCDDSESENYDLDKKHKGIVDSARENLSILDSRNFRDWVGQGDVIAPAQFAISSGLMRGVLRPVYLKVFRKASEKQIFQAFMDDLSVIDLINARGLLRDNPVEATPGVSKIFNYDGLSMNYRWLRYIYLAKRILDMQVLNKGSVWVDIGSYYGGLQGLVHKYSPDARIVLVDFHHQICRSYIYLSLLYPGAKHILPRCLKSFASLKDVPEGSFIYLPVRDFDVISHQSADLVTNFFSFGEMSRTSFSSYFDSDLVRGSKTLYLVNRFVSSPFFEPTYDTDLTLLDYLSFQRMTEYFDVFPIHHYFLHHTEVLSGVRLRNTSSSYFEYVSALKPSRS